MPTLRPFRDYDEKDVINLFTVSGTTLPCNKGTLVKIAGPGMTLNNPDAVEMLGNMGDFSVSNVVAQRYGVIPKITPITAQTDTVLGMTLFDMRETDENGIPLKYNPRKAAEMEACISGQAVPVVVKGIFAYSGITTGNSLTGAVTAGAKLYAGANASLTTQNYNAYTTTGTTGGLPINVSVSGRPIAIALGNSDAFAVTVVRFDAGGLY